MTMAQDAVRQLVDEVGAGRAVVLDVRTFAQFADAHVRGALAVPFGRQGFGTQAAALVGSRPVIVVADQPLLARLAGKALEEAGVGVRAVLDSLDAWQEAGGQVVGVPRLAVEILAQDLDGWAVIDVREPYEWRSGVIPGALRIPLGDLLHDPSRFELGRRYAVVCAHGNRSRVASVALVEAGHEAHNVEGGMALWLDRGLAVEFP
jgi:rhodanese-related sulfurtransferase